MNKMEPMDLSKERDEEAKTTSLREVVAGKERSLHGKKPENNWYEFVEVWASVYVDNPNILRLDQEKNFL